MEKIKSQATRKGMEDNEREWEKRPMLGAQRIYLQYEADFLCQRGPVSKNIFVVGLVVVAAAVVVVCALLLLGIEMSLSLLVLMLMLIARGRGRIVGGTM